MLQIDNHRVDPQCASDVYRVYTLKDNSDWKEIKRWVLSQKNLEHTVRLQVGYVSQQFTGAHMFSHNLQLVSVVINIWKKLVGYYTAGTIVILSVYL